MAAFLGIVALRNCLVLRTLGKLAFVPRLATVFLVINRGVFFATNDSKVQRVYVEYAADRHQVEELRRGKGVDSGPEFEVLLFVGPCHQYIRNAAQGNAYVKDGQDCEKSQLLRLEHLQVVSYFLLLAQVVEDEAY